MMISLGKPRGSVMQNTKFLKNYIAKLAARFCSNINVHQLYG